MATVEPAVVELEAIPRVAELDALVVGLEPPTVLVGLGVTCGPQVVVDEVVGPVVDGVVGLVVDGVGLVVDGVGELVVGLGASEGAVEVGLEGDFEPGRRTGVFGNGLRVSGLCDRDAGVVAVVVVDGAIITGEEWSAFTGGTEVGSVGSVFEVCTPARSLGNAPRVVRNTGPSAGNGVSPDSARVTLPNCRNPGTVVPETAAATELTDSAAVATPAPTKNRRRLGAVAPARA
ncbi:hypothetical protein GCM10027579_00430 [Calidifontibacter terrae]